MTDQSTTVLYVLTTLAQSCAALAAFVGAVGVFRIQTLRDQRRDAERVLRVSSEGITNRDFTVIGLEEILEDIDEADRTHWALPRATKARAAWEAFVPRIHKTRTALLVLEGWNLAVIGVALIGFNYVPALARAPWFSCALVVVAVVTALVPVGCVIVWTRGVEK